MRDGCVLGEASLSVDPIPFRCPYKVTDGSAGCGGTPTAGRSPAPDKGTDDHDDNDDDDDSISSGVGEHSRRRPAAVTSADGIAGWAEDGTSGAPELRILVTAFSPAAKTTDGAPVTVQISFARPREWLSSSAAGSRPSGAGAMQVKSAWLNRSSSAFDAVWRIGAANGWLYNASDPNVYHLLLVFETHFNGRGLET